MKNFLSNYGFTTLASLVVCALLVMVSPLGKQVSEGIKGQADSLGTVVSTSIEGVGIPSTLRYKPKDVVEIGGKNYVILQDRGSNRYLVMDIDGIGKREFNTDNNGQDPSKCAFINGNWEKETCNNQYENSDIDEYLENDYYNSLPDELKKSILTSNIQQEFYGHVMTNPNYKWIQQGNNNYNGCQNTACVLQTDGRWIPWDEHMPVKGELGVYKFKKNGFSNSASVQSNIIKRKVFLPSISEVSSIVNPEDQWEMDKLLRLENGNRAHMWFRDGRDTHIERAMFGNYCNRSLSFNHVRDSSLLVRPTFVIDLEVYQATN